MKKFLFIFFVIIFSAAPGDENDEHISFSRSQKKISHHFSCSRVTRICIPSIILPLLTGAGMFWILSTLFASKHLTPVINSTFLSTKNCSGTDGCLFLVNSQIAQFDSNNFSKALMQYYEINKNLIEHVCYSLVLPLCDAIINSTGFNFAMNWLFLGECSKCGIDRKTFECISKRLLKNNTSLNTQFLNLSIKKCSIPRSLSKSPFLTMTITSSSSNTIRISPDISNKTNSSNISHKKKRTHSVTLKTLTARKKSLQLSSDKTNTNTNSYSSSAELTTSSTIQPEGDELLCFGLSHMDKAIQGPGCCAQKPTSQLVLAQYYPNGPICQASLDKIKEIVCCSAYQLQNCNAAIIIVAQCMQRPIPEIACLMEGQQSVNCCYVWKAPNFCKKFFDRFLKKQKTLSESLSKSISLSESSSSSLPEKDTSSWDGAICYFLSLSDSDFLPFGAAKPTGPGCCANPVFYNHRLKKSLVLNTLVVSPCKEQELYPKFVCCWAGGLQNGINSPDCCNERQFLIIPDCCEMSAEAIFCSYLDATRPDCCHRPMQTSKILEMCKFLNLIPPMKTNSLTDANSLTLSIQKKPRTVTFTPSPTLYNDSLFCFMLRIIRNYPIQYTSHGCCLPNGELKKPFNQNQIMADVEANCDMFLTNPSIHTTCEGFRGVYGMCGTNPKAVNCCAITDSDTMCCYMITNEKALKNTGPVNIPFVDVTADCCKGHNRPECCSNHEISLTSTLTESPTLLNDSLFCYAIRLLFDYPKEFTSHGCCLSKKELLKQQFPEKGIVLDVQAHCLKFKQSDPIVSACEAFTQMDGWCNIPNQNSIKCCKFTANQLCCYTTLNKGLLIDEFKDVGNDCCKGHNKPECCSNQDVSLTLTQNPPSV